MLPFQVISNGWQRTFGVVGVGYAAIALGYDFGVLENVSTSANLGGALSAFQEAISSLSVLFLAYLLGEVFFMFGKFAMETKIYSNAKNRDFETLLVLSDDEDVGNETRLAIRRCLLLLELFAAVSIVGIVWVLYSIEEALTNMMVPPIIPPLLTTMLAMMFARLNQSKAEVFLQLSEEKRQRRLTLARVQDINLVDGTDK